MSDSLQPPGLAPSQPQPSRGRAPILRSPSAKFILRGQAFGFSLLLLVMWTAELLHLPNRVFGDSTEAMWPRIAVRSTAVIVIWLIVHLTTSRLLKRLHELESYLRICGWCRKVNDHGEWLTLEDYFDSRFQTGTSHGICPECSKRQLDQHFIATRVKPTPPPRA
jgi:hypothetical protein